MAQMNNEARSWTVSVAAVALLSLGLYVIEPVPVAITGVAWLALTLIGWWRPVAVLVVIAAMLPLFHHPLHIGDSTLAPSELLLAALLPGSLVILVRRVRVTHAESGNDWTKYRSVIRSSRAMLVAASILALMCVVGLVLLVGVSDGEARAAGLREWRWTLVEPLLFVGLLVMHAEKSASRKIIVAGYATGVVGVAIWGLADGVASEGVAAGGVLRVDGPFPHPNAYALYLLRAVVGGAALLLILRVRNVWLWSLLGLVLLALGLSFARSAVLGAAFGLLLLLPWMSRRVRTAAVAGGMIGILALLLLAGDRMVGTSGTDSLELRGDIWASGARMIRDSPIAGYGPDQFLYVYTPRYIAPAAWSERFTSHAHNLVVDAWVRIGILGLFAVAVTALVIGRKTYQYSRGWQRGDPLAIAATFAIAAALAQGMVDNGYFVHDLAMSAWLLLWVGFAYSRNSQPERGQAE